MNRYLKTQVAADLKKKMVFLAGPRQVGKTTLVKQILGGRAGYLSWDVHRDREKILRRKFSSSSIWVFDEIHKYRPWRNYLKGIYDDRPAKQQILVTGSAQLDVYRRGGDSLQGRYHFLRLHPLSLDELNSFGKESFEQLLQLGGFPEPFFSSSEVEAKRWSREYRTRLVREELTSLEQTQDLGNVELLMLRLPDLVGSPLSINALREDLQVNHRTVAKWLVIFERLYAIFRLSPFGATKIRAVKKEQKHYHFDWSVVKDKGSKFENFVASHFLKWTHYQQDTKGREVDLLYFRDVDGREVDLVITEDGNPLLFVECKWNETEVTSSLRYIRARFPKADVWQVTAVGKADYITSDRIRVAPVWELLKLFQCK